MEGESPTLKEKNLQPKKQMKPRWLILHEQKMNNIRCKILYIYISVILHFQNNNTPLTKHEETIKVKLIKWYRNIKHATINGKLAKLKHEPKVTSNFVKNKKLLSARNSINKKF